MVFMPSLGALRRNIHLMSSWVMGMIGPKKDIFDYEFSGISVWLEPDETDAIPQTKTIAHLAEVCGGRARGLYEFEPHITMLYNIPAKSMLERGGYSAHDRDKLGAISQRMLEESLEKYRNIYHGSSLQLPPSTLNVFRFPPYRCCISFLYMDTTPALEQLHKILLHTFPPDERHDKSGALMPHMSLVYAPESLDTFLFEETKSIRESQNGALLQQPMRAKYLSVWSTEGKTCDWKRLAKVEIPTHD